MTDRWLNVHQTVAAHGRSSPRDMRLLCDVNGNFFGTDEKIKQPTPKLQWNWSTFCGGLLFWTAAALPGALLWYILLSKAAYWQWTCWIGLFVFWRSMPGVYTMRSCYYVYWGLAEYFWYGPKDVDQTTTIGPLMVFPFDMDVNMHMNNPVYNKFCDYAFQHYMWRIFGPSKLNDYGSYALGAKYMRFKREIRPLQIFTIQTKLVEASDKWWILEHNFVGQDGRVKACGISKWLFLKKTPDGKRMTPAETFRAVGFSEKAIRRVQNRSIIEPIERMESQFGKDKQDNQ